MRKESQKMRAHDMKPRRIATYLFAVAILTFASQATASAASFGDDNEVVSFRLTQWKTVHMHEAGAAEKLITTLKKIGCEVKQNSHGDHIDVQYRCAEWKSIRLKSHDDAHQWEEWFKGKGFETHHKH